MSSTLQIQINPKLAGIWMHACYDVPPVVDAADNVDNDFDERATNKEGYVAFGHVESNRKVFVLVRGKTHGYKEFVIGPIDMPHDALVEPPALERLGEHGFLSTKPNDPNFYDDDGKPWPLAGYASYTIMSEIAKGHDVGGFLDEAIGYGANTLVALGMDLGQFAHDHDFAVDPRDPNWPTWIAALYDAAEARRMRVALGVFQQAQALSGAEKQRAWQVAADASRGRWNVLLRLGNEDNVNGWGHGDFSKPTNMGGVLVSTGSRGINNPPTPPNWDFAEWEPPREPRAKTFSDAGGAGWYMRDGYPDFAPVSCPIVCIEPPFFHESQHDQWGDKRWFDPKDALTLGLNIGGNFAGGAFGSSEGLETRPNGPVAAACARAFFRGLYAGFQR